MVRSTKEAEKFIAIPTLAESALAYWSGWSETVLCVTGEVGLEQAASLAKWPFEACKKNAARVYLNSKLWAAEIQDECRSIVRQSAR